MRLKPNNCNRNFIESELTKLLTTAPIYCPECGNEMLEKSNSKTGKKFFGCSGFLSLDWHVCAAFLCSHTQNRSAQ